MSNKETKQLSDLSGLGPVSEKKLVKAGIISLVDLVGADTRKLSKETGISSKNISVWRREAKKLSGKKIPVSKPVRANSFAIDPHNILTGFVSLALILSVASLLTILDINKNIESRETFYESIPSLKNTLDKKINEVKELSIPAEISIVSIVDSSCSDCITISDLLESVKKDHVNVTSEKTIEYNSGDAGELIKKYNIKLIPTVIVSSSQFKKTSLEKKWKDLGSVESDGSLVLRTLNPPYRDLSERRVVGRVTYTLINDRECALCSDISSLKTLLVSSGVIINEEKTLDMSDAEASELIGKYNIEKIPAIILSNDVDAYSNIKQSWIQMGTVEPDGTYVFRQTSPPYKNVSSKETLGLVSLILLKDDLCTECYDVNTHKQILASMSVTAVNESTYDISSEKGKALVNKYQITKVPTFILQGDASIYPSITGIWPQVGSVESDGSHVFRKVEVLRGSKYRDLTTGDVAG